MSTAAARHSRSWEQLFGLEGRESPEYVRSEPQLRSIEGISGSIHLLRRAWDDLQLDGLLLSNGQPTLYIKSVKDNATNLCDVHRAFWNQGICPALALVTPTEVKVYSGLAWPTEFPDKLDLDGRLVEAFKHTDAALRHLPISIEGGDFLARHPESFNPARRVDRCLLENLKATRARLLDEGDLDPATADALLTRAIFCCYLVDRGIIGERYFAAVGRGGIKNLRDFLSGDPERAVDHLYRLFARLRTDFNGDLFGMNLEDERARVSPNHVSSIRRLLTGEDVKSGQMALDFWAYNFSAIPIETISGIYQEFLSLGGTQNQRQTGAYYTPRVLAEVALDMALEGIPNVADRSFLDPSCGSGIFLVGLFNRMAEELRRQEPDAEPHVFAEKLKSVLRTRLYGVDLNPTACRIAAFSLYLALLDQLEPRDIQVLQGRGRFLPNLYRDPSTGAKGTTGTIVPSDYFADDLSLPAEGFDGLVGNPPWGEANAQATRWCKANALTIPQKQAAAAFIWKTGKHLKSGGKACFVLPLKLLTYAQGPGLAFQREWLKTFSVDKVLNLADMGFHLFEGVAHPAMVVRYANSDQDSEPGDRQLEYCIARSETETLQTDVITVSPDDRHSLKVGRLLRELDAGRTPRIWKQALWGTPRDRALLDRLADFPALGARLSGDLGERGWDCGEGFNKGGKGAPMQPETLRCLPFLPAQSLEQLVLSDASLVPRPPATVVKVHGCDAAYHAPHMVFTRGVPRGKNRINVAFSCTDFTFEHALRGVHADPQDEELLRFLTCVVFSPFAKYVFFHTCANWGVERPQLHLGEFEQLPFPAQQTPVRRRCVAEAAKLHRQLERACAKNLLAHDGLIAEFGPKLDRLVLDFYGVGDWEEALIADTVNLWIPSATPRRNSHPPALEPSTASERQVYGRQVLECLNTWAKGGSTAVAARIVRCQAAGLGIVHLTRVPPRRGNAATPEVESPDELDRILDRVRGVLDYGGLNLRYRRNLKVFAGDDLYILKPLTKRYWCRTAALNDADEIAAAILSRQGRSA